MPSVLPEIVIPECIFLEIVRLMTWHANSNALLIIRTKGDENENVHSAFSRGFVGHSGDYARDRSLGDANVYARNDDSHVRDCAEFLGMDGSVRRTQWTA